MTYSTDTWQALENDRRSEPIKEIATNFCTKPVSDIKAVKISFYHHEIYAGEKLLAKIIYDSDDFVTQPWLVEINGIEIHRANTWALMLQLHCMALQARNLAHAAARSTNRRLQECARRNTCIYYRFSKTRVALIQLFFTNENITTKASNLFST